MNRRKFCIRIQKCFSETSYFLDHLRRKLCFHNELNPHHLKSLAPGDNIEEFKGSKLYFETLQTALEDSNKLNIALTGHYGCGKSTVLRTYQKYYGGNHKFLNISLATFAYVAKETGLGITTTKLIVADKYLIEHSILQQIFYQVPKGLIPKSGFKRIEKTNTALSSLHLTLWILSVLCAIIVILNLYNETSIMGTIPIFIMPKAIQYTIFMSAYFALIIPLFCLYRLLKDATIKRVSLGKIHIEIDDEKNPSVLNKHIDEILYFFQVTEYDVVVIEDLDRFNNAPELFAKMREINTLVNSSLRYCKNRKKEKVVFIYAVRDDMFVDDDRTKFFDLMIPIMPVVNRENSRTVIIEGLERINYPISKKIDRDLLTDVAIFINDMRLIHSIMNEFDVYRRALNMGHLEYTMLFAIIVYKCIMPLDYASLQKNSGILYETITGLEEARALGVKELEKELKNSKDSIMKAEKEALNTINELRIVYAHKMKEFALLDFPNGSVLRIEMDSKLIGKNDILADSTFKRLVSGETFKVVVDPTSNNRLVEKPIHVTIKQIDSVADGYVSRERSIENRKQQNIKAIENRARELEGKIEDLKYCKIRQMMSDTTIELPIMKRMRKKDEESNESIILLYNMLKKGYIDETYQAYMTYFYEGDVSNNDRKYVIKVKKGHGMGDPRYRLDNIQEVLQQQLSRIEVIHEAINNVYILEYCSKTNIIDDIIILMRKNSNSAVKIVTNYLYEDDLSNDKIIPCLYSQWPEFWDAVQSNHDLSSSERDKHLQQLIELLDEDILEKVVQSTGLRDYVSAHDEFIPTADKWKIKSVLQFVDILQPKIESITLSRYDSTIQQHMIVKEMYKINIENIKTVYQIITGTKVYGAAVAITKINESDYIEIKYIRDNIEIYIKQLIEMKYDFRNETESTMVKILSIERILDDDKLRIIKQGIRAIEDIRTVKYKGSLWKALYTERMVQPTWMNVWMYLQELSDEEMIDDTLAEYMSTEDSVIALSQQRIPEQKLDEEDSDAISLIGAIYSLDLLDKGDVEKLVESIPQDTKIEDVNSISEKYRCLFATRGNVAFNEDNYEYIRSECFEIYGKYIAKNISEFIEYVEEINIEDKDVEAIIDQKIDDKEKTGIVRATIHLITDDIKPVIACKICIVLGMDIDQYDDEDKEYIAEILLNADEDCTKLITLAKYVDMMSEDNITNILNTTEEPKYHRIAGFGKRIALKANDVNVELGTRLLQRKYISSISRRDGCIHINTYSKSRKMI